MDLFNKDETQENFNSIIIDTYKKTACRTAEVYKEILNMLDPNIISLKMKTAREVFAQNYQIEVLGTGSVDGIECELFKNKADTSDTIYKSPCSLKIPYISFDSYDDNPTSKSWVVYLNEPKSFWVYTGVYYGDDRGVHFIINKNEEILGFGAHIRASIEIHDNGTILEHCPELVIYNVAMFDGQNTLVVFYDGCRMQILDIDPNRCAPEFFVDVNKSIIPEEILKSRLIDLPENAIEKIIEVLMTSDIQRYTIRAIESNENMSLFNLMMSVIKRGRPSSLPWNISSAYEEVTVNNLELIKKIKEIIMT